MKKNIQQLMKLIYPRNLTCVLCHGELYEEDAKGLCSICQGSLQFNIGKVCEICGRMLYGETSRCKNCRSLECFIDAGLSVVTYDTYVKKLLYSVKYYDKTYIAHTMAAWLVEKISGKDYDIDFDCLVPVPLHKNKRLKRGYNQAKLIAGFISEMTGLPVDSLVERVKETSVLNDLSFIERYDMLKDAFIVKEHVYENILLIDDIFTTGHTLNTCAKALKASGVKCVYIATFACGK